MESKSQDKRAF